MLFSVSLILDKKSVGTFFAILIAQKTFKHFFGKRETADIYWSWAFVVAAFCPTLTHCVLPHTFSKRIQIQIQKQMQTQIQIEIQIYIGAVPLLWLPPTSFLCNSHSLWVCTTTNLFLTVGLFKTYNASQKRKLLYILSRTI